jgi:hypothetical protein
MNKTRFTVVAGLILAATASRFIPHPLNFSPIGAIALFGGAQLSDKRTAFLVPLTALFLADLVTGLHVLIPFVYGSFALTVCLGFWLRRDRNPLRVTAAVLAGAFLFFVITNFGVWALLGTYPNTPSGLVACYLAALPYFQNTLLSDLLYSLLLFGSFALAEHRFARLRETSRLGGAALESI